MAEFSFKPNPTLKRIAEISIVQALWKSTEIINKINELHTKIKPKLFDEHSIRLGYTDDSDNYCRWEKIIDYVTENVNWLPLPLKMKTEIRTLVILMGEKIYYFYNQCLVNENQDASWRCNCCRKCAGTKHDYFFSNHGIMLISNLTLIDDVSLLHNDKTFDCFKDACRNCDIEIIEKHQDKIIAYLESLNPGLNLKSKNDIVFNIICMWYLIDPNLNWVRKYERIVEHNGCLRLPQICFSASQSENNLECQEINVPLELVPQMCLNSSLSAFKYFASKLRSLEDKSHFFNMVKLVLGCELVRGMNCRLHFHPNPDYIPEKLLFILNLMTPNEKSEFVQKNFKDLVLCFLPVWPYQAFIPQLLDLCIKEHFKLHYYFLLHLITCCIEIDNRNKYRLRNNLYMELFEKVWLNTPYNARFSVLLVKSCCLLTRCPSSQGMKMLLDDEEYNKINSNSHYYAKHFSITVQALKIKWHQVLKDNDYVFIKKFMNSLSVPNYLSIFLKPYFCLKNEACDIVSY